MHSELLIRSYRIHTVDELMEGEGTTSMKWPLNFSNLNPTRI